MIRHLIGIGLFSLLGAPTLAAQPATPALDTARIEQLTGATGSLEAKDGVFKVSVPRSDLSVNVAGVKLTPPLGLTSWAAFKRMGKHTAVMGDLVLLEDQVNPVMSNWGVGRTQDLARGLRAALDLTETKLGAR